MGLMANLIRNVDFDRPGQHQFPVAHVNSAYVVNQFSKDLEMLIASQWIMLFPAIQTQVGTYV